MSAPTEDRPVEDPFVMIGRLAKQIEDLRTTMAAQVLREPVGRTGWTLTATAPAGTLLLRGQTVNRDDYPMLWKWVGENNPVGFGTGNGSTTFTLPNMQGLELVGAGIGGGDTYDLGEVGGLISRTLSIANMPNHDHNVTNSLSHAGHAHGGFNGGNHGGHFPGGQVVVPAGVDYGVSPWNSGGVNSGDHNHGMSIEVVAGHTINESTVGSGTAVDVRQPYYAVNFYIWY